MAQKSIHGEIFEYVCQDPECGNEVILTITTGDVELDTLRGGLSRQLVCSRCRSATMIIKPDEHEHKSVTVQAKCKECGHVFHAEVEERRPRSRTWGHSVSSRMAPIARCPQCGGEASAWSLWD